MNDRIGSIILLGYGNSGRGDDGLGPALACAVEELQIEGVRAEAKNQLSVDDTRDIALNDAVVFADATLDGPEPFLFERIRPDFALGFRTHCLGPAAMLALTQGLFGARTKGYVLGIRGYVFEVFSERISPKARKNLEAALDFIVPLCRSTRCGKSSSKLHLARAEFIQTHEVEPCLKNST